MAILLLFQLNEGVIYMGQIEDDDAIDKYKYV
jgi:pyruvate kinase